MAKWFLDTVNGDDLNSGLTSFTNAKKLWKTSSMTDLFSKQTRLQLPVVQNL